MAMDMAATMTCQMVTEVWPRPSLPRGTRMLKATAVPPRMPPNCSTLARIISTHIRLTHPSGPTLAGLC